MSLCVSLFNEGNIHVWADSRVSTEIDGVSYLVTDEFQKIRQIGDKVIFISGDAELAVQVFEAIKPESSIELIRDIARGYYKEYFKANKDNPAAQEGFGIELGLYIFTLERGVPVFYQIHYKNDFEIDRQEPNDKQIFTVAARSSEALAYIGEQLSSSGDVVDIDKVVASTYEHLADECIGGYLHGFLISKRGISSSVRRVKEKGTYPKWRGRPFRFHLDMKGNLLANSLTANYAKINSSDFSGGQIIGSSINVGNGMFTVDTSGNMYAGNGRFRGDIEASSFTGGTITGSLITGARIRTAVSGDRIELDPNGFVFYDGNNSRRVTLGTNREAGISGHTYYDTRAVSQGLIYAISDELHVMGNRSLRLGANGGTITLQGPVHFTSGSSVTGLRFDVSQVEGLQTELRSLQSQIDSLRRTLDSHTHTVYLPNHNHGNPQNQNWGDRTFTTSTP